ncbi:MAG TPA: hypothetical protein VLE02_01080 [Nitrosarchaeum sp.]|nr:hypothetical protein [Nitrosarchaeum sp.]
MDLKKNHIIVGVVLVVLIAAALSWYIYKHRKEGYATAGAVSDAGSFLEDQYDLEMAPDMEVPSPHFADIINESPQDYMTDAYRQKILTRDLTPNERMHRVQGKYLLPRTSKNITPYNIDVANPISHQYMVNPPRVETAIKSRFKDYGLSSMIRGDIPIKYHANVPLISKTFQGRDDLNLSGYFSPYYIALYNKYTGKANKSLPVFVSGAGQANGYGGASGEVVMDM